MVVSPFEDRYKTEMNDIFDEQNRIRRWMDVEIALAEVHAELGTIPKDAPGKIGNASKKVKLERVKEIEAEIHHDLMAMVKALSEQAGDSGKYIHLGATSYDIEDSATALIFRDGILILKKRLGRFKQLLKKLAKENIGMACVGRTHGQHAVPTTYGMKFALYYQECKRNIERLEESEKRILVGKMSGATGTMGTFEGNGIVIQEKVMEKLGLKPAEVTNQVIQRDRHAEIMFILSLIACSIEKIAKELRNLQRTEIGELSEPFGKKQVGSSAMPHKRNPHKSERLCSLARVVRANLAVALENIALEHERDLTNSANERVVFSQEFICVDYMLEQIIAILEGLEISKEAIAKNLNLTGGLIMAERVMVALTKKGMGRQDAHELVRQAAQQSFNEHTDFKDEILKGTDLIQKKELEKLLDPSTYLGNSRQIVENALKD